MKKVDIISLTYKAANFYLVPSNDGWVMIDTGWPDTFSQVLQLLNQHNIAVNEINYLIITHYHPAHAGLTQNLKELGIHLLLHEAQSAHFTRLNLFYKRNPQANFRDITMNNSITLTKANSKGFFASIGIEGELISTPVHSDDSISFIIDNHCAFTGDLPSLSSPEAAYDITVKENWDRIRQYHADTVYPGHGDSYHIGLI